MVLDTGLLDSLSGESSSATGASISYDIVVPCTGEMCVHNISTTDADGLSLAPGAAADDSALACFGSGEAVVLPGCGGLTKYLIHAELEGSYQVLYGAVSGAIRREDHADNEGVDGIWTDTLKRSSVSTASAGDTITYTVQFTNHSPVHLDLVRISDALPVGVTLTPGSILPPPQPGESLETGISAGQVEAGGTATLMYSVTVDPDAAGELVNLARAEYYFRDCRGCCYSGIGSSRSCTVLIVPGRPVIALAKSADKTSVCMPCDEITYSLTVSNPGNAVLANVTVYDNIPDGLCYKAGSTRRNGGEPFDENPANGVFIGTLFPGESQTVTFVLFVCGTSGCAQLPGEFVNTAHVSGYAGEREVSATSNSWTIAVNRKCICRCVRNCFSLCDFRCFDYGYVYQTDVKYHPSVNMLKVSYGIAVGYIDCHGDKRIARCSDQLIFHVPADLTRSRFRVWLTDLCCRSDCCGNVAACFHAEICFCAM